MLGGLVSKISAIALLTVEAAALTENAAEAWSLHKSLNSDDRCTALFYLRSVPAEIPFDTTVTILRTLLADRDREVAVLAAWTVPRILLDKKPRRALLRAVEKDLDRLSNNPDAELSFEALCSLSFSKSMLLTKHEFESWQSRTVIPRFRVLCKGNRTERRRAAWLLSSVNGTYFKSVEPFVFKVLLDGTHPDIAQMALDALCHQVVHADGLSRLRKPDARGLIERLRTSSDPVVRERSVELLKYLDEHQSE